jgi:repressor LexA
MQALTRRQQQILDFIQQWRQLRDSMPTRQEIAAHFGFRSPNAVTGHLRLLRKKGVIASEPGKARSLRITSPLAKLRNHVVDIPLYGSIPAGIPALQSGGEIRRNAEAGGCFLLQSFWCRRTGTLHAGGLCGVERVQRACGKRALVRGHNLA